MLFRFVDSLIGLGWAYNQNGTALELDDLWDVAEK